MSNVIAFQPRRQSQTFVEIDGGVDPDDPEKTFLYYVMVQREDGTSWPEFCGPSYARAKLAAEATRQTWRIVRPVVDRIIEEGGAA